MFDTRGVSRERIIGISFVDILIQAVFLLLLILMVGYIDPEEQLLLEKIDPNKNEYDGVGRDLCHKWNKSPIACREYINTTNLGPITKPGFETVGLEVCQKLGKNTIEDCSGALDKVYSLWPCIESKNNFKSPWIVSWDINSLVSAKFLGFSEDYLQYLKKENDTARLNIIKEIELFKGSQLSPNEIESKFGFVREKKCFHEVFETLSVPATYQQISELRGAIYGLRKLSTK